MSEDARFSADEWRTVRAAPAFVSLGVMASDPGGLIGAVKEAWAMGKATREALTSHAADGLLRSIVEAPADGLKEEVQAVVEGATSAMDKRDRIQQGALAGLESALEILDKHATPTEIEAYKAWVGSIARRVAEAGKEGGFLGIGGVRVTESEQAFLDRVESLMA